MISLPATIAITAPIDGGRPFYATVIGDNSVQVTPTAQTWMVTPANPDDPSQGYTLSADGKYLSTQTVYLPYKNQCLVVTPDPAQAARVLPVVSGTTYYFQLVGSNNVLTLDTRGYVTQFEPLAQTNDYPYFQHLTPPAPPVPAYVTLAVQNDSGKPVVAPAAAARFAPGQQAVVAVQGAGCLTLMNLGAADGGPGRIQVTSGALKQVLPYSGGDLLSLRLGADNAFDLAVPGGQRLQGTVSGPAPAAVALPASQRVYVMAFTNAGYLQRVTLTANGGTPLQFQGNGEGNQEIANTSLVTPSDPSGWVNTIVLIEFAPDGTSFQPSRYSPAGSFSVYGYNQRTVVSEDADDDDYNDTAVIMTWWVSPPSR